MKTTSLLLSGLVVIISCNSGGNMKDVQMKNPASVNCINKGGESREDIRKTKLSMNEARDFFARALGERIEFSEHTTADIWEKMKMQVFMVRKTLSLSPWTIYVLDNGEKYKIGDGGFNSRIDLIVTDLDTNGYYELFFSYSNINSIGNVGCYTEGMFLPVNQKLTPPGLSAVYNHVFKKSGATCAVEIHEEKKVTKLGNLFIKKHINGRREVSVY